jgi:hypothetical protein
MDLRAILIAIFLGAAAFGGAVVALSRSKVEPVAGQVNAPPRELAPMPREVVPRVVEEPKQLPAIVARWQLPIVKCEDGSVDVVGTWPKQIALDFSGQTMLVERDGKVMTYQVGQSQPVNMLTNPEHGKVELSPTANAILFEYYSPEKGLQIHDPLGKVAPFWFRPDVVKKKGNFNLDRRAFFTNPNLLLQAAQENDYARLYEIDLKTGRGKSDPSRFTPHQIQNMSQIAMLNSQEMLVLFHGLGQDKIPDGLAVVNRDGNIDRIAGVPSQRMVYTGAQAMSLSLGSKYVAFHEKNIKPNFEVWDWRAKRKIADSSKWSYSPMQCGFTPDGKQFWAVGLSMFEILRLGGSNGPTKQGISNAIDVYDLSTGQVIDNVTPYDQFGQGVQLMAFSGNGKYVALVDSLYVSIFRTERLFPNLPPQFADGP